MRRMERSRRRKWRNWYVVRPIKIADTRLTAFVHRTRTQIRNFCNVLFQNLKSTGGGISNTMRGVTRTGSEKSGVPSLSLPRFAGRHSQSRCRPYLRAETRDKHTGSSLKQRRIICVYGTHVFPCFTALECDKFLVFQTKRSERNNCIVSFETINWKI